MVTFDPPIQMCSSLSLSAFAQRPWYMNRCLTFYLQMCISSSEIHAQGGDGGRGGGVIMLRLMKEIFFLSNDPTANWQWIKGLNDVFKITFLHSALTLRPETQNREINEPSIEGMRA